MVTVDGADYLRLLAEFVAEKPAIRQAITSAQPADRPKYVEKLLVDSPLPTLGALLEVTDTVSHEAAFRFGLQRADASHVKWYVAFAVKALGFERTCDILGAGLVPRTGSIEGALHYLAYMYAPATAADKAIEDRLRRKVNAAWSFETRTP